MTNTNPTPAARPAHAEPTRYVVTYANIDGETITRGPFAAAEALAIADDVTPHLPEWAAGVSFYVSGDFDGVQETTRADLVAAAAGPAIVESPAADVAERDATSYAAFVPDLEAYAAQYGVTVDAAELWAEALEGRDAGTLDDGFNVWVSTFGLYNAGELAGYWVAAEHCPAEAPAFLAGAFVRGVAVSLEDMGEEVHAFDVEGAPAGVGELDGLEARRMGEALAEALETLGEGSREAFGAWLEDDATRRDDIAEAAEQFAERFAGIWEGSSELDAIAESLTDLYPEEDLPEWARGHYGRVLDGLAVDARAGGELTAYDVTGGWAIVRNW